LRIDPRSEVEYRLRLCSKYQEKLGKHHGKKVEVLVVVESE